MVGLVCSITAAHQSCERELVQGACMEGGGGQGWPGVASTCAMSKLTKVRTA